MLFWIVDGLALFKEFLATEFSDENIEFWIACEEYKTITQPKKQQAKAQKIYEEFIVTQACREARPFICFFALGNFFIGRRLLAKAPFAFVVSNIVYILIFHCPCLL